MGDIVGEPSLIGIVSNNAGSYSVPTQTEELFTAKFSQHFQNVCDGVDTLFDSKLNNIAPVDDDDEVYDDDDENN